MTHPADRGTTPRPPVQISEDVVVKIAAYHASQIPGVSRLRRRPVAQAVHRVAQLVRPYASSEGVQAEIDDDNHTASIEIDIVIQADYPCLKAANAIQQQVDTHIWASTGLRTTVTVNIVDLDVPELT